MLYHSDRYSALNVDGETHSQGHLRVGMDGGEIPQPLGKEKYLCPSYE